MELLLELEVAPSAVPGVPGVSTTFPALPPTKTVDPSTITYFGDTKNKNKKEFGLPLWWTLW